MYQTVACCSSYEPDIVTDQRTAAAIAKKSNTSWLVKYVNHNDTVKCSHINDPVDIANCCGATVFAKDWWENITAFLQYKVDRFEEFQTVGCCTEIRHSADDDERHDLDMAKKVTKKGIFFKSIHFLQSTLVLCIMIVVLYLHLISPIACSVGSRGDIYCIV